MRLLTAICLTLGLAMGAKAQETTPITLGYTAGIDYLGAYVAADRGFFENHGYDVTLELMPNSGAVTPGLLSGSLQVGGLTAPSVIQARAAGVPIRVISGASVVTRENPNGTLIIREGVDISSAQDIEGMRIGTGGIGSYYNVLLRQWMLDQGADPDAMTVVEVPFSQMTDVLRSGQIDGATVGHPFWGRMEAEGLGTSFVAFTGEFSDGLLSNTYVASEAFLEENPGFAEAFSMAIAEAYEFIEADPEGARESAAKYLNLPAEIFSTLPFSNYRQEVTAEQIQQWNDIMRGQGLIEEDVDPTIVLSN